MKNIFNKNIATNPSFLPTNESMEFDIQSLLLETLIKLEEESSNINEMLMISEYYSFKDGNVEILQEGFGDFINSCKNFFISLLKTMKEFFNKFIMYIKSYMSEFDKFIENNKEKILSSKPNFTIQGFNYTFKDSIPDVRKIHDIVSYYNHELDELLSDPTREHVIKLRDGGNSTEFFEKLRAIILHQNGEITAIDYPDILFKTFRGYVNTEDDIVVNHTMLSHYVDEYKNLKKHINEVIKERGEMNKLLMDLVTFFENGVSIYYRENKKVMGMKRFDFSSNKAEDSNRKEVEFDSKLLDVILSFYNYKFQQSRQLSHILTESITAKTTALKEAMSLYKRAIRKSIFESEV